MIKISEQQKKDIEAISRSPQWGTVELVLRDLLESINRVTNLGELGKLCNITLAEEAAGKKAVYKQLMAFLSSIGILSKPIVQKRDTSE